jgi:hypothetical protein
LKADILTDRFDLNAINCRISPDLRHFELDEKEKEVEKKRLDVLRVRNLEALNQ